MSEKTTWETLSTINVNEHVQLKKALSYLSWTWAWGITKEHFPDTTYRIVLFGDKPYLFDEQLGYLVRTEVTIRGETLPMHLYVMDGAGKALRQMEYQYQGKYEVKTVPIASMADINKTIMRCLTKNLALFGLGHYIYAGEDLPQMGEEEKLIRIEAAKKPLTPESPNWNSAVAAYQRDGSLDKVKERVTISPEVEQLIMDLAEQKNVA